ncbi:MAG TPA: FAD binding domain-containing protein [Jatrophihabitans sp.]|jgi:CO/xanthine dehydrogenase FAD-binding subunit
MEFLRPTSWADALAAKAAQPDAVPIAGGTDIMVELNFDKRRPPALLDLNRVTELTDWSIDDGRVRLGAGVSYTRVIDELGTELPGLAMASRTIGSPQIRNRGTVGGNLGAASPAGDSHPPLLALDAEVEVASVRGSRRLPALDFYTGVKRNALAADELIAAILLPRARGPQQFCKIGTRNAMVIAVATFALVLHPERARVGTGIGSAAPTPIRAHDAEAFLADALTADNLWESRRDLPSALVREFGARVSAATAPIDDVRGAAAYRRHAMTVMAKRALGWAWDDYRKVA